MSFIFGLMQKKVSLCLIGTAFVVVPNAFAAVLPPGASATVDNLSPVENWSVSLGGTLTIDGGQAQNILTQGATVIFNGGQSQRIDANTSVLNISGAKASTALPGGVQSS